MEDLSAKVLETIKQKAIKPRPRWYFLARGYVLWTLVALATILGGIAFSLVILFVYFTGLGWNHPRPVGELHWLLASIPYAWLLVFLLLVGAIYYNLKHLKKSYKYPAYLLIVASLCGSIILGSVIASFGMHKRMNMAFSRRLPFYGQVFDARIPAWERPSEGALGGKIEVVSDGSFILRDFHGQEWQVLFRDETTEDESVLITPEQMVMINGQPGEPGTFMATEIFPWDGCRKHCNLVKPPLRRPALQNNQQKPNNNQ